MVLSGLTKEERTDKWSVRCASCGVAYIVPARSATEAISKAKEEHEEAAEKAAVFKSDLNCTN